MKKMFIWRAVLAALLATAATGKLAAHDQSIFVFGGALTSGNMHESAHVLRVGYENNAITGFGFQTFRPGSHPLKLGLEIGGASRWGGHPTLEIWGGAVLRHDGTNVGSNLRLSGSFTAGLSLVTATHRGREADLETFYDGNARTLFYLGPEISLSRSDALDREFFWRLHHRSGGGRTLGNMKGAANANVIGLRYRF